LFEYKYGKPDEARLSGDKPKVNINIKNLFAGNQEDNNNDIIDITDE
jgi:hypothetical protein